MFRCDATADIGFGHLSRCIALAEALYLLGVASTFVGQFDSAAVEQISAAGFESVSLSAPLNTANALQEMSGQAADFIVIDSYRADTAYLAQIKAAGHAIVVIDDFCRLPDYPCDAILNFTWEAPNLVYPSGPALLLGPQYLLARRKLVERRGDSIVRERGGHIRNLLIAVGGSDPKGITERLLRNLSRLGGEVSVRAITANPDEIAPLLIAFSPESAAVPRQPDLSDQFCWADAAITGGGLIKYECAYVGVPAAAIAQNAGQDGETQVFAGAGLVFDLGLADSISDAQLKKSLDAFLSDATGRRTMADRMKQAFVQDPTANAAQAILEAIRR